MATLCFFPAKVNHKFLCFFQVLLKLKCFELTLRDSGEKRQRNNKILIFKIVKESLELSVVYSCKDAPSPIFSETASLVRDSDATNLDQTSKGVQKSTSRKILSKTLVL